MSQDIQERDGDKIVEMVRSLVRDSRSHEKPEDEEVEPIIDEDKQPEQEDPDSGLPLDHEDDHNPEGDDDEEFVYYDDEEGVHHDEL